MKDRPQTGHISWSPDYDTNKPKGHRPMIDPERLDKWKANTLTNESAEKLKIDLLTKFGVEAELLNQLIKDQKRLEYILATTGFKRSKVDNAMATEKLIDDVVDVIKKPTENPTGQEREASLDPNCSNNETPS